MKQRAHAFSDRACALLFVPDGKTGGIRKEGGRRLYNAGKCKKQRIEGNLQLKQKKSNMYKNMIDNGERGGYNVLESSHR